MRCCGALLVTVAGVVCRGTANLPVPSHELEPFFFFLYSLSLIYVALFMLFAGP